MRTPQLAFSAGGLAVAAALTVSAATTLRAQNNRAASPAPAHSPAAESRSSPRGPLDWERTVALSPNGRLFVTRNLDGKLRVWDLATGKSEVELPEGSADAVFSPDSALLACRFDKSADGKQAGRWRVVAAADGQPVGGPLDLPEGAETPVSVYFSPDGKLLAGFLGAGTNASVLLWDAASGQRIAGQSAHELYGGTAAAFSPDGKTLATGGSGSALVLWSVPDLKRLTALPVGYTPVSVIAFSPDGKLLAAGGQEPRTVKAKRDNYPVACLYEAGTWRPVAELRIFPDKGESIRQFAFADGGRAVIAADNQGLQAFSAADGRLLANLPEASYPVAVSPDGLTLAGTRDLDLVFWATSTWRLGLTIPRARPGQGLEKGNAAGVPLVFTADGAGIITLRAESAAWWDLPGCGLHTELKATQ